MLNAAHPLLTLSVVLIAGAIVGNLANKFRLPSITGQIVAGLIIGPSVIGIFSTEAVHALQPVMHFALGLVAMTVGSHLHWWRLKNPAKRLSLLVFFESTIAPAFVFCAVMLFPNANWAMGHLLAALAISTAPATIVALVRETRSKGVFVKTLMPAVALNNMACITLFVLARSVTKSYFDPATDTSLINMAIEPLSQLFYSILLGGSIGLALVFVTRRVVGSDRLATASIISILLTSGISDYLGVSNLLSCLFLGITIANFAHEKENIGHNVFINFQNAIYASFFTLAGMELDLSYIVPGGMLAIAVVFARIAGKITAATIAMKIAGAPKAVRKYLGPALIPQAGVAVGLILLIQEDPAFESIHSLFLAVGLTSVILNELIGPILTKYALMHSGDYGKDRAKLIDFINEEHIITDLEEKTKEQAIKKLTNLLITSNKLDVNRDRLLESVLQREKEISTCIGSGLAIPHGVLETGKEIYGVMGISREGLDIETPDGQPVHCMVLLATPPDQRERHLEVLAALARAFGKDETIRKRLFRAKTPAHVCTILQAKEFETFNYFLEEEETA